MAAETKPESERKTLPLAEESVVVNKRTKTTGIVRVRKQVAEEERVIDEPLLVEEVEIERVPVDRWVDVPASLREEGDTTIIPIHAEEVVVEKRLKLVEEIHLTRRRSTRHTQERVTLRREEAEVERRPPEPNTDTDVRD